jgi:ubiquinone/menaquinone biosynthesis C-methylase UbiE
MKSAAGDTPLMSLTQVFGMRPGRLKFISSAVRAAELGKPETLLEVGCGNGLTAVFLCREYGCSAIGIDWSAKTVDSAVRHAEAEGLAHKARFLVADAGHLPFPNSTFDTILCEAVFSTLVNKEMAAKEFNRVLSPGGRLLMLDFILRQHVSEELQSQVSFIPCLSRTKRLEEYVGLFQRAGLQNRLIKDYSQEVLRGIAYWIGCNYGSWDNVCANLSAEPCCSGRDNRAASSPAESFQRFSKEARPGYALLAFTKP